SPFMVRTHLVEEEVAALVTVGAVLYRQPRDPASFPLVHVAGTHAHCVEGPSGVSCVVLNQEEAWEKALVRADRITQFECLGRLPTVEIGEVLIVELTRIQVKACPQVWQKPFCVTTTCQRAAIEVGALISGVVSAELEIQLVAVELEVLAADGLNVGLIEIAPRIVVVLDVSACVPGWIVGQRDLGLSRQLQSVLFVRT